MMIRFGNNSNPTTPTTTPKQNSPQASQIELPKPLWPDRTDEDLVALMLKRHEEEEKTFDQLNDGEKTGKQKILKRFVDHYLLRRKGPTAEEKQQAELALAEQHFQAAKESADIAKELFRRRLLENQNNA